MRPWPVYWWVPLADDFICSGHFGALFRANLNLVPALDCFTVLVPGFLDDLPAMSLAVKPILAIIAASFLMSAVRRLLLLDPYRASVAFKADCKLPMAFLN